MKKMYARELSNSINGQWNYEDKIEPKHPQCRIVDIYMKYLKAASFIIATYSCAAG